MVVLHTWASLTEFEEGKLDVQTKIFSVQTVDMNFELIFRHGRVTG